MNMRKMLICLLLCTGCAIRQESRTTKTETQTQKYTAAEILIEHEASNEQESVFRIEDDRIIVPARTKVKLLMSDRMNQNQQIWDELLTTTTKKQSLLIVLGAICFAGGLALAIFGPVKLGLVTSAFGLSLVACGITIEKYPWVFIILFVLTVVAVAYILYELYDKHNQHKTLTKVCERIDTLKAVAPDLAKQHITDPLAKHSDAKTIKQQTRKARV